MLLRKLVAVYVILGCVSLCWPGLLAWSVGLVCWPGLLGWSVGLLSVSRIGELFRVAC